MKSYLSGMPELKLGLNDKLLFEATGRPASLKGKAVEMEDIKFHQSVVVFPRHIFIKGGLPRDVQYLFASTTISL